MLEMLRDEAQGLMRTLRGMAKRSRLLVGVWRSLQGGRQQAYLAVGGAVRGVRVRLAGGGAAPGGVSAGDVVWIFGSGRSGSTWLRKMMGEMSGHWVWEEPMVGGLFGEFYDRAPQENRRSAHFVMGEPVRRGWIRSIRTFVLDTAGYSNPGLRPGDYLIVKEPNGSVGAPLLMEALPESRMILLIRDPRDVVASMLDAAREGGWHRERFGRGPVARRALADKRPDKFVRMKTRTYLRGVSAARRAFHTHTGKKTLVRYEDLVADTLSTMTRIYFELGIPAREEELTRAVAKHSWKNMPEEEKGGGKFYRKGIPGGWREDLTPKQAAIVERMATSLLDDFYTGPEA